MEILDGPAGHAATVMLFPVLAPRGAHATSLEPSAPSCANSATSGDTGCPARRQAEDAHLSAAAPTATHASQPRLVTTRSLLFLSGHQSGSLTFPISSSASAMTRDSRTPRTLTILSSVSTLAFFCPRSRSP